MRDDDEKMLRKLLWLRHGCSISSLYGDDGEMQCSACLIDFRRDSVSAIQERFHVLGREQWIASSKANTSGVG